MSGLTSASHHETLILDPPTDLISNIVFSPDNSYNLLASSWDAHLYLYNTTNTRDQILAKYNIQSPILDCCFQDTHHAATGGLDGNIKLIDFNTNSTTVLGNHDNSINCVEYCPDLGIFVTGSWDSYIKLWDPRIAKDTSNINDNSYPQSNRVYALDTCSNKIIVGTSDRKVVIWDLRNMAQAEQIRESVLKYQTRRIKSFPNKKGFVLSSIEGRVAVEYLDPSPEVQKNKYAFKCHRIKEDGIEKVYPVNAIAFHNVYGTFATGGSDGIVAIWDAYNKKRLCNFHQYPNQITSLSFSGDGKYLAIGASQLHDRMEPDPDPKVEGGKKLPEHSYLNDGVDRIFVREVLEKETKPK